MAHCWISLRSSPRPATLRKSSAGPNSCPDLGSETQLLVLENH